MACLIVTVQTDGRKESHEFDQDEILVGRLVTGNAPAIILQDKAVSRKHARIWRALDGYWVEDLGSTHGTMKKGVSLMGPERVYAGDCFELGDSLLTIEKADITEPDTNLDELFDVHVTDRFGAEDLGPKSDPAAQIRIVAHEDLFAPLGKPDVSSGESSDWAWYGDEKSRLATQANPTRVFGHLAENFSNEDSLQYSTELAIKDIVHIMESAERGAVLLFNEDHTQLELCAHYPVFKPAFSTTLALNALTSRKAFVWEADSGGVTSNSIKRLNIKCGVYAPLEFGSNQLGIACVDSTSSKAKFTEGDLGFFITLSQVLGALVYGKRLEEKKRLP